MDAMNAGLLVVRLVFGLFLAYHGWNKLMGPGGISGTVGWFGSIGMRWPAVQARLAAFTEIGAGVLFAAGLLTPFAAAGIIGVMIVAIVVAHWRVGFFVFLPDQGWEYCASIAVTAWCVALIGPGEWSLDHAIGMPDWMLGGTSFTAGVVALGLGVAGAVTQLAVSYRPPAPPSSPGDRS
jgi:putative oxidoreductase